MGKLDLRGYPSREQGGCIVRPIVFSEPGAGASSAIDRNPHRLSHEMGEARREL